MNQILIGLVDNRVGVGFGNYPGLSRSIAEMPFNLTG
jgi:hypothetical protein